MFTLRQAHIDATAAVYRVTFEDRMVRHLGVKFPSECEALGEEKVRDRIRDGVVRSQKYEIGAQPDVSRFIRFMFAIRPDFDTARQTAWARPILEDTNASASDRLDRVREEARKQRRAKRGKT
ncbi:MAG: hypothetical protein ACE5E5_07730 [Phycisphaerae bacterium]